MTALRRLPSEISRADCGKSLPPQDAAIGTPENPRRYLGIAQVEKAIDDFFHRQTASTWCRLKPIIASLGLVARWSPARRERTG